MSERCLLHKTIGPRSQFTAQHVSETAQRPEMWNINCKSVNKVVVRESGAKHGTQKRMEILRGRDLARERQCECRSGLARNGKTLSAGNRPRNLSAQTRMVETKRGVDAQHRRSCRNVGMRMLFVVDRLVQQLYMPAAILLGSRKMKTLPALSRLQKERE